MMSQSQNELITRVSPETPCGDLLRRYWQPAALSVELDAERPTKAVELLGEKLVLFRDEAGRYGLMDRQCPHRGADLCYGRLEDGGLRCPFHGWLFDVTGQCLEQPAEPEGSTFYQRIKSTAYPCVEKNGIVFTYMGPGEPPAVPELDCLVAPQTHSFAFKGLMECNWLQALEVGIDPAHASFLHRYFEDADASSGYGQQFRDNVESMPMTQLLREFPRPEIIVDETDYGMRLVALRRLSDAHTHVRVTNLLFPQAICIPMSQQMTITQWHVPIDDVRSYWYAMFTSFGDPVDQTTMREQREALYELPDYIPKVGKQNNYGFDPDEQRTRTYTGMGDDINVHDQWAVESPGPIADRTKEHLGQSDIAIVMYRRMLRAAITAIEENATPHATLGPDEGANIRGPVAIDTIGDTDRWQELFVDADRDRRSTSNWASSLAPEKS